MMTIVYTSIGFHLQEVPFSISVSVVSPARNYSCSISQKA
jgi:hypothetical protein